MEITFTQQELQEGIVKKTINSFGCSLKIDNHSKFTIDVHQGSVLVDRIPPHSYLYTANGEYDLSVNQELVSTNEEPYGYVSTKRIDGQVKYETGSTNFSGSLEINGDVNIQNSQLDVVVQNDLNANITNSELNVVGDVNANITNSNINATITNASLPITGNVNANIENAQIKTDVINQQLKTNKLIQFLEVEREIDNPVLGTESNFEEAGKITESGIFDSFVYTVAIKMIFTDGTSETSSPIYNKNYFYSFNNNIPISLIDVPLGSNVEDNEFVLTDQVKSFQNQEDGFTYISETYKRRNELVIDELRIGFGVFNGSSKTVAKLLYTVQMFAFDSDSEVKEVQKVSMEDTDVIKGHLSNGSNRTGGDFNTGYLSKPKNARGIMIAFRYLDHIGTFTTPKIEMVARNTMFFQGTFGAEYTNIPTNSSPNIYTNVMFHEQAEGVPEATNNPRMYYRKIVLPNDFLIRVFKNFSNNHNYDYEIYYEWIY